MPIDSILAALVDRRRTSGELIVGVKEPGASRGVSTRGVQLPLAARDAAVDVIRQNFPDLAITTIGRTFVVVRPPVSRELLVRLHELCVVDYLAPNWSNGVVGATP